MNSFYFFKCIVKKQNMTITSFRYIFIFIIFSWFRIEIHLNINDNDIYFRITDLEIFRLNILKSRNFTVFVEKLAVKIK